jgi:ATP-binding cassette subfamily B protein/ATP-binding cassette subfamily C protein
LVRKKKHASAGVAGIIAHASRSNLLEGQLVENPANFFIPPRTAYTPQIPQLFSYSLQENLLLGLERSEIEIAEALQLSVFERDGRCYVGRVGDGPKGVRLSWGQLQRAAAARMSVRHPSLLVFDDLSSALDIKTEQKLW